MRFRGTVELGGKTATGIPVPDEIVAALGAGNRPAVVVTVNGFSYRTTAARMGGRFFVPLSAEHARAFFDGLSFTHRKEWVRWIEEAKKPDTRTSRVQKTVESLRAGKRTR